MPIFRVKSVKIYTGQKNLHGYIRGIRDKYEVWKYCAQIITNQSQDGTAGLRTMLVIGITCVFERHCPSKCDVQ